MKTPTVKKDNLALLPTEVKEQIVKENCELLFNTEVDMKKRLFVLLSLLGLPSHLSGYDYIKESLIICIDNNYTLPCITKYVYPPIKQKYGKSASQIERAIRHAISVSIDRGNPQILFTIFGYTINSNKKTPTSAEYLAQIAKFLEAMCN